MNEWPYLVEKRCEVRMIEIDQYDDFIPWSTRVFLRCAIECAIAIINWISRTQFSKYSHIWCRSDSSPGTNLNLDITRDCICTIVHVAWINEQTRPVLISNIMYGCQPRCVYFLSLDGRIRIRTITCRAMDRVVISCHGIAHCLPGHILDQQPG